MALGTDQQAQQCFEDCERNGSILANFWCLSWLGFLACFAFTERSAGVLSGFSLKTTAKYDIVTREFILNTPSPADEKYWISQVWHGNTCPLND